MSERTTIELSAKNKMRLVSTAAKRGFKGFSRIIDEALELYFQEEALRSEKKEAALALQGTFSDKESQELLGRVTEVRSKWRS